MVPAAFGAVGGLATLMVVLRAMTEVSALRAELDRARALRPALVELQADVDALAGHARRLRHR